MRSGPGGFALLTVLWVLVIISAIALSLTAASGVEARIAASERDAFAAERLAASALEMVPYLDVRGLGTPGEDFTGLPVEVLEPGFHYRLGFPEGRVDLFLESEGGKINPATAPEALLFRFFSNWRADPQAGEQLTQAFQDWIDPDDEARLVGAEATVYLSEGYLPRNGQPGVSDLPLVRGIGLDDLRPHLIQTPSGRVLRGPLDQYLTTAPVGSRVNPNLASGWVLQAVPGLDSPLAERIVEARAQGNFRNLPEFIARLGLTDNAELLSYVQFDRGTTPALLAVARAGSGQVRRSVRRAYSSADAWVHVERNVFPDFAESRLRGAAIDN